MIQPLLQPIGSPLCGQTAVAMIIGIPLERAIELVGKKGGTRIKDLEAALLKREIRLHDRVFGPPPTNGQGLYLCSARWPKRGGHWILLEGSRWIDPAGHYPWPPGGRIVAYWQIQLTNKGIP